MPFKSIIIFLIFLFAFLVLAQNKNGELEKNRSRLKEIQQEINNLKNQINKSRSVATDVYKQIDNIDKEMSLIQQAKGLLLRQQKFLENRLKATRSDLESTKHNLEALKGLYAKRVVYMYKYGTVRDLELILTSQSFNQAIVRLKYLKLIAEQDEKTIRNIDKKRQKIETLESQLSEDLDAKSQSIKEKLAQERQYENRKDEKNTLLTKIKKDQNYYKYQLTQKQKERDKLASIIALLEQSRKKPESEKIKEEFVTIDFDDFKKGKGKLPWPVKGTVMSNFGKQYDPISKTYVNNSGIEIQSKIGTPVKCVYTGVVRMITYLSGYGNTVIIDHGHGYYSVYSHLGEIYVRRNDVVETNQIVALVGDSGSLAGSKLHFEIYGGNHPYDPLTWLR